MSTSDRNRCRYSTDRKGTASMDASDSTLNGSMDAMLTPELLYKMNKKIAQLTKVVYGLNTRGEELEAQLAASQQAEEKSKIQNSDLQLRVNNFKSKIEAEMVKLRDFETQASQSQFWKMEYETMKRRYETEGGIAVGGESRASLVIARDEAVQCRRREKAVQFDLDQARIAITNLKAHHDFIMRERDAQQGMEREKIVLEWQARMSETENRYKSQLRRATDDLDVLTTECDLLRRKAKGMGDESIFRDQINLLQQEYSEEKRDWERKLRQRGDEMQEERIRLGEEKREADRKIRSLHEEKRRLLQESGDKLRSIQEEYEDKMRDITMAGQMMQRLLDDKEEEFEGKLKAKIAEWKTQWELAEGGIKDELRQLKEENEILRSAETKSRSSVDESSVKIQDLEGELSDKRSELELKAKNFNVRVNMLENKNKQILLEKSELENQLGNERERNKDMLRSHETLSEPSKDGLQQRLEQLGDSDSALRAANRTLEEENERLNKQLAETQRESRERERLAEETFECEKKELEDKIKLETERISPPNERLSSEARSSRSSIDKSSIEYVSKIQDLEDELSDKRSELELKAKNFNVRITMLENRNKQILQEKSELENQLENERERHKDMLRSHETLSEQAKDGLQQRLEQLEDSDSAIRATNRTVEEENDRLNKQLADIQRKNKERESLAEETFECEKKELESKIKQKIERIWIDKLQNSEEAAAQSISKVEEARKRKETSQQKEIQGFQTRLEDGRKLHEDLKKRLRELRQKELESSKKANDSDRLVQEFKKKEEEWVKKQKEVDALDKRYQGQVDQLTLKLAEKQQESSSLKVELEGMKQAQREDKSEELVEELQLKIEQLNTKVAEKDIALEGIRLGLQQAKNEAETSKTKIHRLEDELKSSKQGHLSSEEQTKSKFTAQIEELDVKIKSLEERLEKSESRCRTLQQSLDEIEEEREEELKIVQDALDEAAQEREDLIETFKKELEHANNMNSAREQQMLDDFEWKLSEMEKDHKKKMEEREKQAENTLTRPKRHVEDEESRQKVEKMRNEINAEWEDKLRSECSRLKRELDELHSEEKHLAVESIKVQKEQEIFSAKTSFERKIEELNKSISTLNDRLTQKDAYYQQELESIRTISDRDIWGLRMKLQKLDASSLDKLQLMEENHRDQMERLKTDNQDRVHSLETRVAACDAQMGVDVIGLMSKKHSEQMQYLEEQHKLSMVRFREESESDRFQSVEEARVILTRHHEDIRNGLKDQLSEALSTCSKLRDEVESIRSDLANREEELKSLEEDVESLKSSQCDSSAMPQEVPAGASCTSSGISSSQYSLASSSNGSRLSQDRLSLSDLSGVASENHDEAQKSVNGTLLGKVFGGGWFASSKSKEGGRRGSTPCKQTC